MGSRREHAVPISTTPAPRANPPPPPFLAKAIRALPATAVDPARHVAGDHEASTGGGNEERDDGPWRKGYAADSSRHRHPGRHGAATDPVLYGHDFMTAPYATAGAWATKRPWSAADYKSSPCLRPKPHIYPIAPDAVESGQSAYSFRDSLALTDYLVAPRRNPI